MTNEEIDNDTEWRRLVMRLIETVIGRNEHAITNAALDLTDYHREQCSLAERRGAEQQADAVKALIDAADAYLVEATYPSADTGEGHVCLRCNRLTDIDHAQDCPFYVAEGALYDALHAAALRRAGGEG